MSKAEQRRCALAARRGLSAEQRRAYSAQICERLMALPGVRGAGLVLSYRAMADEVDLGAVHDWLRERGQRVVFPVCGEKGQMEAYEPGAWKQGPYGIWEPDPAQSKRIEPGEIDLVLVPCVAFDPSGMRLGHGAGYYDRYLPYCTHAHFFAVAFEAQRLERVDYEQYDKAMNAVITENKIYAALP